MPKLDYTKRFRRDYKLCQKQGRDMQKLHVVLEILAGGAAIPVKYKDHALNNNWKGYRDLHIEPDWILIYQILNDGEIVLLAATGSHSHTL